MSNGNQKFLPAIQKGRCDEWTDSQVSATILQTVMMILFSQAGVSVPTSSACSVSALESWGSNLENQWTTPTPCSTKLCVGGIGGNSVYQNTWESNTKTNSLTETSNIWTSSLHHPFQQDSLETKNPKQPTTSMQNFIWTLIKQQKI